MAVFQRGDGTTFEAGRDDPSYAKHHKAYTRIDRPVHVEPRDATLDAALRDDFDATASIYCDWLLERGDPRGKLGTSIAPADRDAFAREHGLLNNDRLLVAAWDRGFVRSVEVDDPTSSADSVDDLFEILYHPSFRVLAVLTITVPDYDEAPGLMRLLADCPSPPPLTSLAIGSALCDDDFVGLSARYPRLERLEFSARRCEPLDLPRLIWLGAECSDRSLAASRLPAVTSMSATDSEVAAQMIERGAVPALRGILVPWRAGERLIEALARSPIRDQLESLTMGSRVDEIAAWEALLSCLGVFSRLTTIVVHGFDRASRWTSQLERTGWRFEDGRPYVWRRA